MVVLEVGLERVETDVVPMDALVVDLGTDDKSVMTSYTERARARTVHPSQAFMKSLIHCLPLGRDDIAGEQVL